MAELNKADCEKKVRNTGVGGCPVDFGPFVGGCIVPDKVWKKTDIADLRAWFHAGVHADNPLERFYPIQGWEGVTKNTQDPTFWGAPSGRQVFVKNGDVDVTYQFIDGGLCLSNRLESFNNDLKWKLIRWDDNGRIQATSKLDADGNPGFAGIPLKVLYTYPADENDHANPTLYRIRFAFDPKFVNKNVAFIDADFPLEEITGLIDINLTISGTPTGGVYQVLPMAGCGGGVNLYGQYSTKLASAALWKMYNNATGAEIAITSVAANAGLKAITVTADTADPDYTAATATGLVRIELVGPTALDAADIPGYEGIPVTVVRGA